MCEKVVEQEGLGRIRRESAGEKPLVAIVNSSEEKPLSLVVLERVELGKVEFVVEVEGENA